MIVHLQIAAIQKLRNSLGIGQLSSRLCVGCWSRHQDKAPEGSHFHTNVFCPLTSPPKKIIPGKTDWTNCICNSACRDISNDLGAFTSSCIWTLQKKLNLKQTPWPSGISLAGGAPCLHQYRLYQQIDHGLCTLQTSRFQGNPAVTRTPIRDRQWPCIWL